MKRYCRNCYHPLPYKAKYCAHCGQKDTDGRIGMKSLMGRLWNNTFHLEGKFIRTAWQLFVPGKVTTEFFKGKQERYPHPIRLFAIVMFLFLLLLNSMLKDREAKDEWWYISPKTTIKEENGDSLKQEKSINIYEQMKYSAMLYDLHQDYEKLPPGLKTPQAKIVVDSLLRSFASKHGKEEGALDSLLQGSLDSTTFGFGHIKIASLDLVRYEPDEIIERYHMTQWMDRLIDLEHAGRKTVWIVGGGGPVRAFLDAGLVRRLILFQMPLLLGAGTPLWPPGRKSFTATLRRTTAHEIGVVETEYEVGRTFA